MFVLGVETTCDETAAAVIVREPEGSGRILSNVVYSQISEHAVYGGVVPEVAARCHVDKLDGLICTAMEQSGLDFAGLDAVATASGPGLTGGLIVGLTMSKSISLVYNKPLLSINHLEAHALSARLCGRVDFPYLLLLLSGGHTQLLHVRGVGDYRRLGTTIDDALGEAFDKTAKMLGLPYPGGPSVELRARRGDACRFSFPRPMYGREELHFSFSGLKTAVRRQIQSHTPLNEQTIADICASFQSAVTDTLIDRSERAILYLRNKQENLSQCDISAFVIAGGVAANESIRISLSDLCKRHGLHFIAPPVDLCTDNGAMIAWAGAERFVLGKYDDLFSSLSIGPRARWPLDCNAVPAIGAGVKA